MTDRVFATSGNWALAADPLQWILQRRYGKSWRNLSFVSSSKDILARCMREKCVDVPDMQKLLSGLPDTFESWKAMQSTSQGEITQENPQGNLPG
jgi:hypothetical protein